ncbi:hypothetical protein [Streptomyces bauhiniae]|uniref:hypothetical protein n=1 Tax=Streptomyces bauhiniae TaxID=2340725 RepID=UPI0037FE155E
MSEARPSTSAPTGLAEQADEPRWWHSYRDVVPGLQAPDCAGAVLRGGLPNVRQSSGLPGQKPICAPEEIGSFVCGVGKGRARHLIVG